MQASAEHLVEIDNRLNSLFLPHDLFPQRLLEVARCGTLLSRVQLFSLGRLYRCWHNVSFTVVIKIGLDTTFQFVPGGTTLVRE